MGDLSGRLDHARNANPRQQWRERGFNRREKTKCWWWCRGGGLDGTNARDPSERLLISILFLFQSTDTSGTTSSSSRSPSLGGGVWTFMSSIVINGAAAETGADQKPEGNHQQQVQQQQQLAPRCNKPIRLKNHSVCNESYDTLHRASNPVGHYATENTGICWLGYIDYW